MSKIVGTNGNDMISGTKGNDTISGLKGNDLIDGKAGNDNVSGGDGADKLLGSGGHDWLDGGNGIDALFGGDGNDFLFGGGAGDYLNGGAGNDRIDGGAGFDMMRGDIGNDTLYGGDGDDYMGGAGNDTLVYSHAGQGDPLKLATIDGGTGSDTLVFDKTDNWAIIDRDGIGYYGIEAQAGTPVSGKVTGIEHFKVSEDTFLWYVGRHDDVTIAGGAQDDYFSSGTGDEVFTGGLGEDSYQFSWLPGDNLGHDTILDFKVGEDHLTSRYADYDTAEHILDVVQTETAQGTRFQSYDHGELVHTLDVVGVFGLPADTLYQPYAIFGPLG